MKLRLAGLLTLALAVASMAPAAYADAVNISLYTSTNGTTFTLVSTCVTVAACNFGSVTAGGITVASSNAESNSPGTAAGASTNTTQLNINSSSGGSLFLLEIAQGFTTPNGVGLLNTQESTTGVNATGVYSAQTTGYMLPPNSVSNSPSICSNVTGTLSTTPAASAAPPAVCTAPANYDLATLMHITLNAGANFNLNTSVGFQAVPEPASMALFGSGLFGLAGVIRRKRAR
jgi:hypothetical protein